MGSRVKVGGRRREGKRAAAAYTHTQILENVMSFENLSLDVPRERNKCLTSSFFLLANSPTF
jgi:hypothetical protein